MQQQPANGVPILGQRPQKMMIAPQFAVIPTHVRDDNMVGEVSQGEAVPREWFMDGSQLLDAIQAMIRVELRAALADMMKRDDA